MPYYLLELNSHSNKQARGEGLSMLLWNTDKDLIHVAPCVESASHLAMLCLNGCFPQRHPEKTVKKVAQHFVCQISLSPGRNWFPACGTIPGCKGLAALCRWACWGYGAAGGRDTAYPTVAGMPCAKDSR